MVYTPIIPARQTRNLSARAQDLNQKLGETIDAFRRHYPDTTDADVRNALLSTGTSGGGGAPRMAAVAATLVGLVLAGAGVMAFNGGLPVVSGAVWIGIAGASVAVMVAVARLVNRS